MKIMLPLLLILVMTLPVMADTDQGAIYVFTSTEYQQRFEHLSQTFRCLVCQNQTLSDSNAPLAMDLRRHLYDMIQAGESDSYIIDYFVSRYGDFVLYSPPVRTDTFLLWFGPLILLGVGGLVLYRTVRAHRAG